MLKLTNSVDSRGLGALMMALSAAVLLLWPDDGQAERFKQRGVSIPDAPDMFVQGATRLDRNESGADLTLPLNTAETWELLNRVLANLNIKPREQDAHSQRLLTDWILWVWSPKYETGSSKPPLRALSRTWERHRFEFSVSPDADNTGAVIHISDNARQKEVDITPDSEYSWLQWQDASVQAGAAWSFMRRLQGNFESALTSRLVPSTVVAPRIIEPVVKSPAPTRPATPVKPSSPAPDDAPAAVIVESARTMPVPVPVPSQPIVKQSSNKPSQPIRPPAVEPRPAVAEKPARIAKQTPPVPPPTVEAQPVEPAPSGSENSQRAAMQPPEDANIQPAPSTPMVVQGGLLVEGGMDATWQALLEALEALGVELQGSDQAQHMLTTQWVNAMYDKKNQHFELESKTEERWAFNLWGKGRERHRFQLILIPVDGGARTMVYGYHTAYQVETDQTPDSSQTLLYWKDHKTEPAIAMAFLRRLRLVVRQ